MMFNDKVLYKLAAFIDAAQKEYPDITSSGVITRKQVDLVHNKYGTQWPSAIVNTANSVSRGLYKFPKGISKPIDLVEEEVVDLETDEALYTRISDTYSTLSKLVRAVSANTVNSLIIAGAPGLGKSYEVNKTLSEVNSSYVFHRGYLRATHLFRMLWENRGRGQTIVLDDTDSIFGDETALNILKGALELKDVRTIGWGSEKEFMDENGDVIPRYFQYEGNVIFLTNLAFSDMTAGSGKNSLHLAALDSRSLVLDLKIKTKREIMAKIKQTIKHGMLTERGLTKQEEREVLAFMEDNVDRLKELSLRMAEKIAALVMLDRTDWERMARTVCLK